MRWILLISLLNIQIHVLAEVIDSTSRDRNDFRTKHFFVPVQYAGNIGYFSAGAGYAAKRDLYQLSLVYGYVPPAIGGSRIHMVSARNVFHLYKLQTDLHHVLIGYACAGLSMEVGGKSFFSLPDVMPAGYYSFPKSIHLVPAVGIKLRREKMLNGLSQVEFFSEISTVDAYLWYKAMSSEVRFSEILSVSAGVSLFPSRW